MNVLITGASGFVGGFLVEEALHRGMNVYASVRKTSDLTYLQDTRITLLEIDFNNKEQIKDIFRSYDFEYVIHNAGVTKAPTKEAYFHNNATCLNNIIESIIDVGKIPKKFTFISSLAAYGPAEYTSDGQVSNASTPHPVTNYGRSKLKGESYLTNQTQIPYNIIRPTAVYGPREWDLFTVYKLINKGLEMSVGMKDQILTFVYVKDLVDIILDITLSNKENVAYFVSDLEIYTTSQYNQIIRDALRKKTLKIKLPIFIVSILAFISERVGKISGKYPPLNMEKVNELQAKSWAIDTRPLVDDFGYSPKYKLNRGIKASIEWYQKNKYLT